MKAKLFLIIAVAGVLLGTAACRNSYEITTFQTTDSYGSVFKGRSVPQDVR